MKLVATGIMIMSASFVLVQTVGPAMAVLIGSPIAAWLVFFGSKWGWYE